MNKKEIFLAGSTFWGGQGFLDRLPGVIETELGVTDGGSGTITETFWLAYPDSDYLGTAECIKVIYDADVISLPLLLKAFFLTVDPYSVAKQINDSAGMAEAEIFFIDPEDEVVASKSVAALVKELGGPVTIEVVPLKGFRPIGTYADEYIKRNLGDKFIIDPSVADAFVTAHESEFGQQG